MLLAEHLHKPIRGDVLTIGRQSVDLSQDEMDNLCKSMGVPKRKEAFYEVDHDTVSGLGNRDTISDRSFFSYITGSHIRSLDVSAYEKASIVFNLEHELPRKLYNCADFIFDGGCLDNIFDPAAALRNISRMLRPGGRFLSMNTAGPHPTAYLKLSADWYMDFFAINQYADCKTYICNYPNSVDVQLAEQRKGQSFERSPYQVVVYAFNPYVENAGGPGYDCSSVDVSSRCQLYCIAEKGKDSTDSRNPIQKHYRVDEEHRRICVASAKRFFDFDSRPLFKNPVEFDPSAIKSISTSDYQEQMRPVAVVSPEYLQSLNFKGSPSR
jgi:SAM-dependent methyltransferase